MACLIVEPPIPKYSVSVHRARVKAPPTPAETCRTGPGLEAQSYTGAGGAELAEWIRERRAQRWTLDHLGDLDGWLHRKPTLTDLECLVMDRRKTTGENPTPSRLLPDMAMSGVRSEEVLVSQQTARMASETHIHPSTPRGPTGRAVEDFRKQIQGEYLHSLKQCQKHELPISQSTLQRALLHPEDVNMCKRLALKQTGSGSLLSVGVCERGRSIPPQDEKKEEKDKEGKKATPHKVYKNVSKRQPFTRHADPNAFWPGHDSHVRFYQPERSNRPENVLFHLIKHNPATSPGHWPVNQAGYFTSGDINKNKTYCL
ncbi:EF-hand calcium-binding domain-containing protein 12 isoform X2 [Salminus brasiliensis]|uniref:EF-hand calcium-binding domain-containing protein 12 isoform X2 n=1 Tax=Salminus brasiliensis TaxID=930266 RepID=UPI003B8323EA